jgi:hypothetical protein
MREAGQSCVASHWSKTSAVFFLVFISFATTVSTLWYAPGHCHFLINTTWPTIGWSFPMLGVWVYALRISLGGTILLMLLDEVWRLWNPFGSGIDLRGFRHNPAQEIDGFLYSSYVAN